MMGIFKHPGGDVRSITPWYLLAYTYARATPMVDKKMAKGADDTVGFLPGWYPCLAELVMPAGDALTQLSLRGG
jgi:hypothetical protein